NADKIKIFDWRKMVNVAFYAEGDKLPTGK
ncbi:unnamed protein product, partial [marine sediment metagenome]